MSEFQVNIPEEDYSILQYTREGLPGIAVVNKALCDFEPKDIFAWHLSVIIDFEDLTEQGMPSRAEQTVVDPFCEQVDELVKGAPGMPNALFLARMTWNSTRQMVWRVYNPEIAYKVLQELIDSSNYPRQFDFRMEEDPEWKFAKWHLDNAAL